MDSHRRKENEMDIHSIDEINKLPPRIVKIIQERMKHNTELDNFMKNTTDWWIMYENDIVLLITCLKDEED